MGRMGRIVIFSRKINLAYDDLYLPAFYGILLHGVWLGSTISAYLAVKDDCRVHHDLKIYCLALVLLLGIQVPLDVIVMALSMLGSVANPGPRRHLGPFIHVSSVVILLELGCQLFGISVVYGANPISSVNAGCGSTIPTSDVTLVHMVLIWSIVALALWFIILSGFLFSSQHTKKFSIEKSILVWQRRLEYFCIRSKNAHLNDSSEVMKDVANELAHLFHDVDWAPSDIVVGLTLLKREQKRIIEVRQARRLLLEKPHGFHIPELEEEEMSELTAVIKESTLLRRSHSPYPADSVRAGSVNIATLIATAVKEAEASGTSSHVALNLIALQAMEQKSSGLLEVPQQQASQSIPEASIIEIDDEDSIAVAAMAAEESAPPHIAIPIPMIEVRRDSISTYAITPPSEYPSNTSDSSQGREYFASSNRSRSGTGDSSDRTLTHDDEASSATSHPNTPTLKASTAAASSHLLLWPQRSVRHIDGVAPSGASIHSEASSRKVYSPFKFRRGRRKFFNHRSPGMVKRRSVQNQQQQQHGTLTREEIDDILHFAFYAELVYVPEDVREVVKAHHLLAFSDNNTLFFSPYLIVQDPETECIVISVRGTFSAADMLVDLKFDLEEFDIPELRMGGCEESHYAHSGMLRTARNIVEDIVAKNVLGPLLKEVESEYCGWPLIVVGHSLGGGVAALITCMLREEFPTASCYAYEPPGCLLSSMAATYFESFCTTIIMGDDIVPRVSKNSMEMLKMDVRRVIYSCDHPKWRVLGSVVGSRLCCGGTRRKDLDRPGLLHKRTPSGKMSPEDLKVLRRRTDSLRYGDGAALPSVLPSIPMFVPGRILHIEKFRRPPIRLNQAIGGAITKAKEAGGRLKDGAGEIKDRLLDGAEGIKDRVIEGAERIFDGAEGIADRIKDGADGIKERLKDGVDGVKGKVLHRERAGFTTTTGVLSGGSGSGSGTATGLTTTSDLPAVVELKQGRPRAGSLDTMTQRRSRRVSLNDLDLNVMGLPRKVSINDEPVALARSESNPVSPIRLAGGILRGDKKPKSPRSATRLQLDMTEFEGLDPAERAKKERAYRREQRKARRRKKNLRRDSGGNTATAVSGSESSSSALRAARSVPNMSTTVTEEPLSDSDMSSSDEDEDNEVVTPVTPTSVRLKLDDGDDKEAASRGRQDGDLIQAAASERPRRMKRSRSHSNALPIMTASRRPSVPNAMVISPSRRPSMPNAIRFNETTQIAFVDDSREDDEDGDGEEEDEDAISPMELSKPQYPPSYALKKGGVPKEQLGLRRNGKYHYIPRWAKKEEFAEIVISRTMVADHSPFELLREFQQAPAGSVLGVVTRD
ncbi:hypothetical protein HK101_006001 [Irineochytrium annulatum]|nr:hypothetical protein HK101_006001 [Irineochytrium annulatum]